MTNKSSFKSCFCAKAGFTLIELLVVVLIIGVLAAVAVPQYQRAVEKARMTEAIINVRAIANAHQRYYLANGTYLGAGNLHKLDITIPGVDDTLWTGDARIKTKDFIYSPNGDAAEYLALAQRVPVGNADRRVYRIFIEQSNLQRIRCRAYSYASEIQKRLCDELDSKGIL